MAELVHHKPDQTRENQNRKLREDQPPMNEPQRCQKTEEHAGGIAMRLTRTEGVMDGSSQLLRIGMVVGGPVSERELRPECVGQADRHAGKGHAQCGNRNPADSLFGRGHDFIR